MSPTPSKASSADLARYYRTSQTIRLVSEPTRVHILMNLGADDAGTGELAEVIGVDPSAASNHIALLKAGGLVESRRGRCSLHTLTDRGRKLLAAIEPLTTRV